MPMYVYSYFYSVHLRSQSHARHMISHAEMLVQGEGYVDELASCSITDQGDLVLV